MLSVYVDSRFEVVCVGSTDQLMAGLETDRSKHFVSEALANKKLI